MSATKMATERGYLDIALRVLGGCLHSYTCQQAQEVAREMRSIAEETRERCALLHEVVCVADDREPMAVVIEYRDMIRALPLPPALRLPGEG